MNNAAKNQIYQKKSQYISLDWYSNIIVWNESLTDTKTSLATIIRHEKRPDMQNSYHLQKLSITGYYWSSESELEWYI